jgi:hypothetical protein
VKRRAVRRVGVHEHVRQTRGPLGRVGDDDAPRDAGQPGGAGEQIAAGGLARGDEQAFGGVAAAAAGE